MSDVDAKRGYRALVEPGGLRNLSLDQEQLRGLLVAVPDAMQSERSLVYRDKGLGPSARIHIGRHTRLLECAWFGYRVFLSDEAGRA